MTFYVFLSCYTRFLEHWLEPRSLTEVYAYVHMPLAVLQRIGFR